MNSDEFSYFTKPTRINVVGPRSTVSADK